MTRTTHLAGALGAVLLGVGIAAPGIAAPDIGAPTTADDGAIQSCLEPYFDAGRPGYDCIGAAFDACIAAAPSDTTVVMAACAERELGAWDGLLNVWYGILVDELDPDAADRLRALQRSWIGWRDARCAFEASLYDGGTLQGPATTLCRADATAVRALELSALVTQWVEVKP